MSENAQQPAEEIQYLEEILREYGKYVENIGHHGLEANLLLYYRDEVQDTLEDLEGKAPLQSYWREVVEWDQKLRENSAEFVNEIGRENYSLQRDGRMPPKTHWWWYLDRGTSQTFTNWLKKP